MATPKKTTNNTESKALDAVDLNEIPANLHRSEKVTVPAGWPELGELAYQGPIGEAVRAFQTNTESDPAALLALLIAHSGVLIGRKPHLIWSGQEYTGSLFAVLVGPTAHGRKGTAGGDAKRLLSGIPPVPEFGGFGSGESIVTSLAGGKDDADTKADGSVEVVSDPMAPELEVEPISFMIQEEEFSRTLAAGSRAGSTLSESIRQLFDGRPLSWRTAKEFAVLKNYHSGFIGHVTPGELRMTLSQADQVNGLANRYMMIASHRRQKLAYSTRAGNPHHVDVSKHITELAKRIHAAQGRSLIKLSQAAADRLADIYFGGKLDSLSPLLSRLFTHLCRVTLVFAAIEGTEFVHDSHVNSALALVEYAKATTDYVFPNQLGNQMANKLLTRIKEAGPTGISTTDLTRAFNNHLDPAARDAALSELIEDELILVTREGRTKLYVAAEQIAAEDAKSAN